MRAGREGGLIEIVRDESVVASGLLVDSGSTLCLTWAGMSQEVSPEKLEGAFAALYYFTILHGYELGRDYVWFGQSRPLANDGVFRYKRQWRTRVIATSEILGDILIQPLSFSGPVQSVFANNCFIIETSSGLVARILLAGRVADTTEIRDLSRRYGTEGVDRLEIFSLLGFEKSDGEETLDDGTVVRRVDLSRSRNPALDFCQM